MSLYNWCKEYLADGDDIPDADPYRRRGKGLKRVAVDHYFEHGKCLARTCKDDYSLGVEHRVGDIHMAPTRKQPFTVSAHVSKKREDPDELRKLLRIDATVSLRNSTLIRISER
mgnify:CR=1 FL=1